LTWAFAKFRHYIHGSKFTVRTDHEALQWLSSARYKNAKLEHWALRLQEFDLTVMYKKGCENVVADCLSRLPLEDSFPSCSIAAVWPKDAKTQVELDRVPCEICGDADAWDNIVICDGCDQGQNTKYDIIRYIIKYEYFITEGKIRATAFCYFLLYDSSAGLRCSILSGTAARSRLLNCQHCCCCFLAGLLCHQGFGCRV